MSDSLQQICNHLMDRLRQVQRTMGIEPVGEEARDAPLADLLDSMGMAGFLTLIAVDCAATPAMIEESVQRLFGSVRELAHALHTAGLNPVAVGRIANPSRPSPMPTPAVAPQTGSKAWLAATAVHLPAHYQAASEINTALSRPRGWLEDHAGIHGRHLWSGEDPIAAAADAARRCLEEAKTNVDGVGALLVTSEAPPLTVGLAAALHDRLHLPIDALALEVGGACTGFLAAMRTAQALLHQAGNVLIIAVEAHSHYLTVRPGNSGENAALFGDAAAACLLCDRPLGRDRVLFTNVHLGADGSTGHLLKVDYGPQGFEIRMQGTALAIHAVRALDKAVRDTLAGAGLTVNELKGLVVHAGNGRMAPLLARQLRLPPERLWSETATTGNLGSASLPVAWAAHQPAEPGPVVWTAVGAGLMWGTGLTL